MDKQTKLAIWIFSISMIIVVGFTMIAAHVYHQQDLAAQDEAESGEEFAGSIDTPEDMAVLESSLRSAYLEADIVARVNIKDALQLNESEDESEPQFIAYGIEADVLELFKGEAGKTLSFEMTVENELNADAITGEAIVFIKAYEGGYAVIEDSTERSSEAKIELIRKIKSEEQG